jgi:hypothetical protein
VSEEVAYIWCVVGAKVLLLLTTKHYMYFFTTGIVNISPLTRMELFYSEDSLLGNSSLSGSRECTQADEPSLPFTSTPIPQGDLKVFQVIINIINMLMPVKLNSFETSKKPKWYLLTAAFWAQLASVADGGFVLPWEDPQGPIDWSQQIDATES